MKKLLFIAPLPPPINGQSKASAAVLKILQENCEIKIVDLQKPSLKSGTISIRRLWDIIKVLIQVWKNKSGKDFIYLSLAESFAGNMRDLCIYFICRKNLSKIYIHMLGGAEMKKILSRKDWQQKANAKILNKIGGVIVEGDLNFKMFRKFVPENKIHLVPNFADDFLFLSKERISQKFKNVDKIQVLYLSNLLPGKGYEELLEAYLTLSPDFQRKLEVTFVGGFESIAAKNDFLKKINLLNGIKYLGNFIDGEAKVELYRTAHVFCLPTYYPYEGQPISILEAYAAGCVVITTDHSGIPFIFEDKKNGYEVEKRSIISLSLTLAKIIQEKDILRDIALFNSKIASENFSSLIFKTKICKIFQIQNRLKD